jgi:hypothetical protein
MNILIKMQIISSCSIHIREIGIDLHLDFTPQLSQILGSWWTPIPVDCGGPPSLLIDGWCWWMYKAYYKIHSYRSGVPLGF